MSKPYFRVQVVGREHVPTTGGVIISPIHRSNLDTPVVCVVTQRRLRYMGKESLWKRKSAAWFLTAARRFPGRAGHLPIAKRSCLP